MKIILDAMGGDLAPEAPVMGAIDAVKDTAKVTYLDKAPEEPAEEAAVVIEEPVEVVAEPVVETVVEPVEEVVAEEPAEEPVVVEKSGFAFDINNIDFSDDDDEYIPASGSKFDDLFAVEDEPEDKDDDDSQSMSFKNFFKKN